MFRVGKLAQVLAPGSLFEVPRFLGTQLTPTTATATQKGVRRSCPSFTVSSEIEFRFR